MIGQNILIVEAPNIAKAVEGYVHVGVFFKKIKFNAFKVSIHLTFFIVFFYIIKKEGNLDFSTFSL